MIRSRPLGRGSGTLGTTYIITTVQYILIAGVSTPVGSRANVRTAGVFDDGKCVLTFAIGNGIGVDETDAPSNFIKPASHPDFVDPTCLPTRIYGSWGDISQITMMIECPTPVSPTTWGRIKTLYRRSRPPRRRTAATPVRGGGCFTSGFDGTCSVASLWSREETGLAGRRARVFWWNPRAECGTLLRMRTIGRPGNVLQDPRGPQGRKGRFQCSRNSRRSCSRPTRSRSPSA